MRYEDLYNFSMWLKTRLKIKFFKILFKTGIHVGLTVLSNFIKILKFINNCRRILKQLVFVLKDYWLYTVD